jgi:tetratricopeptide (TPR) repeat protein
MEKGESARGCARGGAGVRAGTRAGPTGPLESATQYSGACPVIDALALAGRLTGLLFSLMVVLPCSAAPASATGAPVAPARAATEPRLADAYREARRLEQAGQAATALARLDTAPPEQAREPRVRFLRGVLLAELDRTEEAAIVYTGLTQEFPELADPYNNLAVLRAGQGRLDEARVALEAALRADPAHRQARENLGDVYVRLAVRLWEGLGPAPGRGQADAELSRKLRLAREIAPPAR